METYIYEGPIMLLDKSFKHRWKGETTATSRKRAKENLIHQIAARHSLSKDHVLLPGNLYLMKGGVD